MLDNFIKSLVKREKFYLTSAFEAFKSLFSFNGLSKKLAALAIIFEMTMALLFGFPVTPRGQLLDMSKFVFMFSDEFDGDALDETKWEGHGFNLNADYPHARRGSFWAKEMLSVGDGCLRITTDYCPEGLRNGPAGYYNSGIQTFYTQKYGYFECRCILPKGEGIWAAFWMFCDGVGSIGNGGVDGAELDIFESPFYMDRPNNCVHMNIHYDGYAEHHKGENEGKFYVNNPYEEFNTYGMEWNEDEYIFYINGVEACRTDFGGASQVPEYMILSVEMESEGSEWTGVPTDRVINSKANGKLFPSSFVIDYVRAYQYKELAPR
jgi:beta-glucanase (GH16 family)